MTQLEILTAGLYTAITEGRKSTAPTQDPNALATATTQANAIYNYLGGGSGTYATQQWVVAQGYITAAALTPYLTIAAAATLYQPLNASLTDISAITGQTTNQVIGWNGTHWVAQTNGGGTVSSVSAGTGMNFATITTSGSVSIDTTKVPYLASGFGVSAGLLKWSGSAWSIDTSTYITSGTGAGGNLGGTYPNPNVIGILGANFPALPTSGSYQLQASITAGTVTSWSFVAPSSGSVTTVSVATANGFAGTVANPTTTPAITIKTTITGILKGNGTAISAAVSGTDYAPATSGSAILYGNSAGGFSNVTIGSGLTFSAGTLSASGGGTVTSVAMTVPTGLSISGSPITTSGTLALTLTSGYVIPTTTEETNWNTAYTNRITSLTTTGTSGVATLTGNVLNIPNYATGMTNPMTTLGDTIYEDATPTAARLAGNTTTTQKFYTQTGNGTISAAPSWFDLFGTANTWSKTQTFTSGSSATGITVNGNGLASTSSPDVSIGGSSNRAMIKLGGGSNSQGVYIYYNDNTAGTKGLVFNLTDTTGSSGQGFIFSPVNLSNTPFGIYPKYTGTTPATQMEFPGSHDVRIVQRGGNSSSRYLRFYTDNNLGASDVERLAIQGGSNTPYAYFNNVAGLGIGVTTPSEMLEVSGNAKVNHLVGRTSAPTIAAGTGAGTSPTVSISGTDLSGYITVTTGTLPTLSATIVTVTFNTAYGTTPKCVLIDPANNNAAMLSGVNMIFADQANITTTTFVLTAGTTALTAATTYKFYYTIIQ